MITLEENFALYVHIMIPMTFMPSYRSINLQAKVSKTIREK